MACHSTLGFMSSRGAARDAVEDSGMIIFPSTCCKSLHA